MEGDGAAAGHAGTDRARADLGIRSRTSPVSVPAAKGSLFTAALPKRAKPPAVTGTAESRGVEGEVPVPRGKGHQTCSALATAPRVRLPTAELARRLGGSSDPPHPSLLALHPLLSKSWSLSLALLRWRLINHHQAPAENKGEVTF